MATSEPLGLPYGLCIMPLGLVSQVPEVPQFTLRVFPIVPSTVPRRTQRLHLTVSSPLVLPSPSPQGLGIRNSHACRVHVGRVTRLSLVRFRYGPDGLLALPRPGRLLSSFHPLGRPNECRV